MLNKNYFKYLLKSKKYFVVIIFVIEFVLTIGSIGSYRTYNSFNDQALILYIASAVVAFVLPLVTFSYVHNKKAVDSYFSLGISRKEMLITNIIFCLAISFLSYFFSLLVFIIGLLIKGTSTELAFLLSTIPVALINYLALIVFNSFIYLLANSVFDGIVILAAYSFLPLAFYIIASCFQSTFIIGVDIVTNYICKYLVYLSPLFMTFFSPYALKNLFVKEVGTYYFDVNFWTMSVVNALYLIIFAYLLYKVYIDRDVERSGDYSNSFFAYPFIIGIYTALSLLFIACCLNSYWSFYEIILLYVLIFVLYIAANFIYKRKFSLPKFQTIMFVLGIVLSLIFNTICLKTNGFGLSNLYKFDYDLMSYDYYAYFDSNAKEFCTFLRGLINDEDMLNNGGNINIVVESKNKEVVDILEKYREKAIYNFYNVDDDEYIYYSSLTATYGKNDISSYYNANLMSVDDMQRILELDGDNVSIIFYFYDYGSYYLIFENNTYMLIEEEYYSIYDNFGYDSAVEFKNALGD